MIDLIRRMMPDAVAVEEQHGTGRVSHLRVTAADGVTRPCVLRRAPLRELQLCRSGGLEPETTGAPALLGAVESDNEEAWLLLETLPEQFPDYSDPAEVAACYQHLAAIHCGNPQPTPDGPWAITETELTAVLTALPESARLAKKARLLAGGPVTLVHGDFHRWNLCLVGDRVRVLDWEQASFAHPVWDLVLLAPEEPGWDGAPRGPLALHALRTYHEAGPLARLPYIDFMRLQTLARIFTAARWFLTHRRKLGALPPGAPRDQVEIYAEAERARVRNLIDRL